MKLGRTFQSSLLGSLLLLVAGCAGMSTGVSDDEHDTPPVVQTTPTPHDPTEAAILAAVARMAAGESGAEGGVSFVVGRAYTAASGRTCKPVTLSGAAGNRVRVACAGDQQWFFSQQVFVADSHRE